MYPVELATLLRGALRRLESEMRKQAPHMATRTLPWLRQLAHGKSAHEYFSPDWGYPVFALPWWVAATLTSKVDLEFQRDLVYSTVNGYYFIRLIDDLMDADAARSELLPATAFFHSRFQTAYERHFAPGHPYWRDWDRDWMAGHDAAMQDAQLADIDLECFVRVVARKTRAARIPVRAVCYRYGRTDAVRPWMRYCDALSRYVQMVDDLFDWPADRAVVGRTTYFLSEADRRRRRGESTAEWVEREGLSWGLALCLSWLDRLAADAAKLGCLPLREMLVARRRDLLEKADDLRGSLGELIPLAAAWGPRRNAAVVRVRRAGV